MNRTAKISWAVVVVIITSLSYLLYDMMREHKLFEFVVFNDFPSAVYVTPLGGKTNAKKTLLPLYDGQGAPYHRATVLGKIRIDPGRQARFFCEVGRINLTDIYVKTSDGKDLIFPVQLDRPVDYYINNEIFSVHVGPEQTHSEALYSTLVIVEKRLSYRALAGLAVIFSMPLIMLIGMILLGIKGRSLAKQKPTDEKA